MVSEYACCMLNEKEDERSCHVLNNGECECVCCMLNNGECECACCLLNEKEGERPCYVLNNGENVAAQRERQGNLCCGSCQSRNSSHDISKLIDRFQQNSVLTFPSEIGTNNSIHFLDVHVAQHTNKFKTLVFKKPTDTGVYLNAVSECPYRYEESSIKVLVHRTYKISSDWRKFSQSINNLKQTFINNGYSNVCSNRILNDYVNRMHNPTEKSNITTQYLFHCNQFKSAYKTVERMIKQIVQNNARHITPN